MIVEEYYPIFVSVLYSYPMELHMVFYKSEYESMEEAMKNKDGLLVLALFYEVCKQLFQVYIPT